MAVGQFGDFEKMNCRYCNEKLEEEFSFGSVPMTPNAVQKGLLLKNGKPIEYEC